jgi:hypothetical protein
VAAASIALSAGLFLFVFDVIVQLVAFEEMWCDEDEDYDDDNVRERIVFFFCQEVYETFSRQRSCRCLMILLVSDNHNNKHSKNELRLLLGRADRQSQILH